MAKTGVELIKEAAQIEGAVLLEEWGAASVYAKNALEQVAKATIKRWNVSRQDHFGRTDYLVPPELDCEKLQGKQLMVDGITAKTYISMWKWYRTDAAGQRKLEEAAHVLLDIHTDGALHAKVFVKGYVRFLDKTLQKLDADIARGGPQKRRSESLIAKAAIQDWRAQESAAQEKAVEKAKDAIAAYAEAQKEATRRARAQRAADRKAKRKGGGEESARAKRAR